MIRIALLGAGFMGRMHSACYANLSKKARLVVVADGREENASGAAAAHKAEVVARADDVFTRDDIDMVDICLPTYMHCEYVLKAAAKGLNILCEKPMSHKPAEAHRMVNAVRKARVKFMVGHVIRFWPEYQVLKSYVDKGTLGKLRVLSLLRVSPKPTWTWQNWIVKHPLSGGALCDLHVHDTDFVRYICGDPPRVESVGSWDKVSGWDYVFSNFSYPGVAVSAEGGWNMPAGFPFEMAYRAVFEKGTLQFSSAHSPSLMLYRGSGAVHEPKVPKVGVGASAGAGNISDLGGYLNELQYFVKCVDGGKEPEVVPAEDSAKTVELLAKEIRSATRNR